MKLLLKKPNAHPKSVRHETAPAVGDAPACWLIRAKRLRTEFVPLSRTQLWRLVRAGEFPKPVRLSKNAVAWRRDEVEAWVRQRERA